MSNKALLLAVLVGLLTSLPALSQTVYSSEAAEVRTLRGLYLQAGVAFPTGGFPVSTPTLVDFALRLAARVHDPALHVAIEDYLERLGCEPGEVELAIINRFALEGHLRGGEQGPPDVVREHLQRPRLWELSMAWSIPDRAAFLIEVITQREYLEDHPPSNLPTFGLSGNPVALENDQLGRGLLWYDFDPLELHFGRERVHFGPLRSSLLPSERLPYLDMLRLTLPLGSLTMDLMISSLQNRRAKSGYPDLDLTGTEFEFQKNTIFANLHRFEYHFGRMRAAVTGMGIFVRHKNAFALADFFPVASWHATQYRPFNLSLVFDLEAVLFPGFRVMGQLGFDDVSLESLGIGDAPIPTIPAVIAGLEYRRHLARATIHGYAEGGYTHYLWGNFDDESHAILARAIYRLRLDQNVYLLPLTSPYGPGAIWLLAEAGLELLNGLSTALQAELVFTNPDVDLISTDYPLHYGTDPALGALANKTGSLALSAEVGYAPWDRLALYARPKVLLWQQAGAGFELTVGASAALDWRRGIRGPAFRHSSRSK